MDYQPNRPLLEQVRDGLRFDLPLKDAKSRVLAYVAMSLAASVIVAAMLRPSVSEMPWVLLAGFLFPIQLASIVAFIG